MKIPKLLLATCILSMCALTSRAQQVRYATKSLTVKLNGDILTAIDASGKHVANVDLTKPALKGKVVAFAYSSKKKEISDEANEPVNSLTLFPNPASKQVQLNLKGNWKFPVDIQILDRNGNALLSNSLQSTEHTLNIASLRQGVYILKAESGESRAVEKLVVE
ncbi:Por secretion system C-terminal sorting domain-containing protein [Dyadobacter soli]|uniref:Por secretion system C-terminal sorting domain-containing protein n=1 Tax=Dyadobacter soli TaxID=659014 RepID=A0A1G7NFJ9_9BACT|nr:T9SS type A sorting domain-containing protein [Dyadobacter soli]SDF72848.1 Por secretion system C-terminal sorting domain-containing protein [Dyadobacter soli]